MKLHICALNWSKWSGAVTGYGGQIQVRACVVCEKIDWRNIGYAEQVKQDELNNAARSVLEGANNE